MLKGFTIGSWRKVAFPSVSARYPVVACAVACGIPCTLKSDLKKYPSLDASLMYNQFRQKSLVFGIHYSMVHVITKFVTDVPLLNERELHQLPRKYGLAEEMSSTVVCYH